MVQRAEALVLEDNPYELEETSSLITGCGLIPFDTTSPQQAIRWLSARRKPTAKPAPPPAAGQRRAGSLLHAPTLAIVDWNMELSGDDVPTSEAVLRKLHALHPHTLVIVYGAGVGSDLDIEERIAGAHPAAIRHDKQRGMPSLLTRINQLLTVSCGDLQLDRGSVLHMPTGLRYRHAMAMKLILAYPRAIHLEPRSSEYMAARRFGQWLEEIGSSVSLVSPGQRTSFYQLEAPEATEQP